MTRKERLVSVADYAKMLNQTTANIYKMISAGKLKTETLGKRALMVVVEK